MRKFPSSRHRTCDKDSDLHNIQRDALKSSKICKGSLRAAISARLLELSSIRSCLHHSLYSNSSFLRTKHTANTSKTDQLIMNNSWSNTVCNHASRRPRHTSLCSQDAHGTNSEIRQLSNFGLKQRLPPSLLCLLHASTYLCHIGVSAE